MAFNWEGALKGALRGAAPDVVASVDQGRNIQSLIQSRQFQDMVNQFRLQQLQTDARNTASDRALLSDEDRRQIQIRGNRRGTTSTAKEPSQAKQLQELVELESSRSDDDEELTQWIKDQRHRIMRESSAAQDVLVPSQPVNVPSSSAAQNTIVPSQPANVPSSEEPLGLGTSRFEAAASPPNKAEDFVGPPQPLSTFFSKPKLATGSFTKPFEGGAPASGTGFGPPQTINSGFFSGGDTPSPFPQAAPAPPTFDALGIPDVQTQQVFSEIEARFPGLRQLVTSDPQGFQRLFAAINSGKITQQDAVKLIQQSLEQ